MLFKLVNRFIWNKLHRVILYFSINFKNF